MCVFSKQTPHRYYRFIFSNKRHLQKRRTLKIQYMYFGNTYFKNAYTSPRMYKETKTPET